MKPNMFRSSLPTCKKGTFSISESKNVICLQLSMKSEEEVMEVVVGKVPELGTCWEETISRSR